MSASEDSVKRRLVVDTQTPGTEITIIDSAGKVVESAAQRIDRDLSPELYKIRYRVGDRVVDQLIELPPGEGPFTVEVPELPILSVVPLWTDADAQSDPAKFLNQLLRRPRTDLSKRASLFIFVRSDPDSSPEPAPPPEKPGSGVSVHAFSGEKVGDLENAETLNGCSACTIPVGSGSYILRVKMPSGRPVEQALVAVDGWQTQFYVRVVKKCTEPGPAAISATPASPSGPAPIVWQLDLGRAGVLMTRDLPQGPPDASSMRWTAAARQALAAGRSAAAPDRMMMNALLSGKFENPMLGIYAGHLLALQEKPNLDLLREVLDNLIGLIGNHPDVTSLMIPLADSRARDLMYREPPMLRSSWSLILSACTPGHDLRSPQSYAARIGGGLWGSGAWLAWRMPAEAETGAPSEDVFRTLYGQAVSGKLSATITKFMESEDAQTKLTSTEALLARYFDMASSQLHMAQELTEQEDRRSSLRALYPLIRVFADSELQKDTKATIANAFTPDRLIQLTGMPYSLVLDAASSLASKLGIKNQGPSLISHVFGARKFK